MIPLIKKERETRGEQKEGETNSFKACPVPLAWRDFCVRESLADRWKACQEGETQSSERSRRFCLRIHACKQDLDCLLEKRHTLERIHAVFAHKFQYSRRSRQRRKRRYSRSRQRRKRRDAHMKELERILANKKILL